MSANEEHPSSNELAWERTYLAAERTVFAILRTGLSIAGGGSLVISLLGDAWPSWVQVPLVVTFLLVGYTMVLLGLRRYRHVAALVETQRGSSGHMLPSRTLMVLTVSLQVAIVVVVLLFLIEAFETTGS